jgi:hypothetical protein
MAAKTPSEQLGQQKPIQHQQQPPLPMVCTAAHPRPAATNIAGGCSAAHPTPAATNIDGSHPTPAATNFDGSHLTPAATNIDGSHPTLAATNIDGCCSAAGADSCCCFYPCSFVSYFIKKLLVSVFITAQFKQ